MITRCILMELASQSHSLEECYVRYVKKIADYGIALYVIYEEELINCLVCKIVMTLL